MFYLGIDLGGTNIAAGICNENGEILVKKSIPTRSFEKTHETKDIKAVEAEADIIVSDMALLTNMLLEEMKLSVSDIEYAGIAAPGTADPVKGELVYANNLPFLNYPLSDKFAKASGISKVYIENDANAAAKGEAVCGAAKGVSDVLVITLGTGVGGGVIIDNKIFSGFNHAGAELGHMVIVRDGKQCTCGRKGCYEAYASATALKNITRESMLKNKDSVMWELCDGNIENVSGRTSFDGMRKGDAAASAVVDEYISNIACGIVNLINIFQPKVLCIGGGISNEKEYLLKPLLEIVEKEQYSRHSTEQTEIRIAELRNDAGIIGAAMLGL